MEKGKWVLPTGSRPPRPINSAVGMKPRLIPRREEHEAVRWHASFVCRGLCEPKRPFQSQHYEPQGKLRSAVMERARARTKPQCPQRRCDKANEFTARISARLLNLCGEKTDNRRRKNRFNRRRRSGAQHVCVGTFACHCNLRQRPDHPFLNRDRILSMRPDIRALTFADKSDSIAST